MRIAVPGRDGGLRNLVCAEVERQGHAVDPAGDAAIYLPGTPEELSKIVADGRFHRLVLRSNAFVYGSNPKNPGLMVEERISLLPQSETEQVDLVLEQLARRHPNS